MVTVGISKTLYKDLKSVFENPQFLGLHLESWISLQDRGPVHQALMMMTLPTSSTLKMMEQEVRALLLWST